MDYEKVLAFIAGNRERLSGSSTSEIVRCVLEEVGSGAHAAAEELKTEGNTLFKEERFEEAHGAYTRALALDPANPVYYSNRGLALMRLGRESDAVADFRKVLALDPTYRKAYVRLSKLLRDPAERRDLAAAAKKHLPGDSIAAELDASADVPHTPVSPGLPDFSKMDMNALMNPETLKTIMEDSRIKKMINDPEIRKAMKDMAKRMEK